MILPEEETPVSGTTSTTSLWFAEATGFTTDFPKNIQDCLNPESHTLVGSHKSGFETQNDLRQLLSTLYRILVSRNSVATDEY